MRFGLILYVSFVMLAFSSVFVFAAEPPAAPATQTASLTPTWARKAGSGEKGAGFCRIAVDREGSLYAVGSFYSYMGFSEGDSCDLGDGVSLPLNARSQPVIAKYDSAGRVLWARTAKGPGTAMSNFIGIAVDTEGHAYAAGSQEGGKPYDYGNGVIIAAPESGASAVLVKYDPSGKALWARTVTAGSAFSGFRGLALDGEGNAYAVGYQYYIGSVDYGDGKPIVAETNDQIAIIVKFDASGKVLWSRAAHSGKSIFNSVAVDGTGNVYAAGVQEGKNVADYGNGVKTSALNEEETLVLVKYGADGGALWARSVETGKASTGFAALAVDGEGNVYAAGKIEGNEPYGFGSGVEARGCCFGNNALLVKYDGAGRVLWARTASGGDGSSSFESVSLDGEGGVLACGTQSAGILTFGTGVAAEGRYAKSLVYLENALLVEYDKLGVARQAANLSREKAETGLSDLRVRAEEDGTRSVFVVGRQTKGDAFDYAEFTINAEPEAQTPADTPAGKDAAFIVKLGK